MLQEADSGACEGEGERGSHRGSAPPRRATQPALLQRCSQRHARLVVSEMLRVFVDVYMHVYPRSRTRKG